MASARVFDTGIPSLAILILGPRILSHDMLEFPYLQICWLPHSENVSKRDLLRAAQYPAISPGTATARGPFEEREGSAAYLCKGNTNPRKEK